MVNYTIAKTIRRRENIRINRSSICYNGTREMISPFLFPHITQTGCLHEGVSSGLCINTMRLCQI